MVSPFLARTDAHAVGASVNAGRQIAAYRLNFAALSSRGQTAKQAGYPEDSLLDFHKHNIYPRIGMAYKLTSNGKTVIRAGYGLYGNTLYGTVARNLEGGPFGGSISYFNSITNGVPLLSFPNPFVPEAGQVADNTGLRNA